MATVGVVKAIITADTTQLKKGMTDAQRRTDQLAKNMTKVGKSLTMKVTMPLVGVGIAAAKMASDFEFSMTQIETLVGRSTSEVETLKGAVLGLSGETGRAPKELADAMFFITSAGLDASSATAALEASAKAAAVGLGDTVIVADAVTNAMNGYGMSADGAAFATDVLAKTVEQGKASAADLAPQFGRLIPMAAELGISFDQVGGGLAFLTRASGDAAMSATQLGGVMKSILKPSQMAKGVMEDIGINLHDLRAAASEDLLGALQGLRATLEANGLEMSNVFEDIRGLNGALQLTGVATGAAREVFDELANSSGKLDEAFQGVQKTAQFQMSQAMSAMKASMISLGEAILPVVIPMLQGLASIIEKVAGWFSSLSGGLQTAIVVFGVFAAAAGPMLWALGALKASLVTLGVVGAATTASLAAFLVPLAAIVAVGAVVFSLFKKWGDEAKIAEERQKLLTDQMRDMNDPATTMVTRIDELVDANVRLKAALDDSAKANSDGADATEEFIGQATLQKEIIERDLVGAFAKLDLSSEQLEAAVRTGTDAFDKEYDVLNALSTSVYTQNLALKDEEQAVKDVAAAVRQSIADKDISLEQGAAILRSIDETADAHDDHIKVLEDEAKAYLSDAEKVQGFIDLLGEEQFQSIKTAGAGKTHAEQLALFEDAVLGASTQVQVMSHRQREAAAQNDMVRASEAALRVEERRLNEVRMGSVNMMVESSEAADEYRDAINGSLPPLHVMIGRLNDGLGPALDQTKEKWDALVVSAMMADRAMLTAASGKGFDIEDGALTDTAHWVGVANRNRAEAAALEAAIGDEADEVLTTEQLIAAEVERQEDTLRGLKDALQDRINLQEDSLALAEAHLADLEAQAEAARAPVEALKERVAAEKQGFDALRASYEAERDLAEAKTTVEAIQGQITEMEEGRGAAIDEANAALDEQKGIVAGIEAQVADLRGQEEELGAVVRALDAEREAAQDEFGSVQKGLAREALKAADAEYNARRNVESINRDINRLAAEKADLNAEEGRFQRELTHQLHQQALAHHDINVQVEELADRQEELTGGALDAQRELVAGLQAQQAVITEVEQALVDLGVMSAIDAAQSHVTASQAKNILKLRQELEDMETAVEAGEVSMLDLWEAQDDYNSAVADSRKPIDDLERATEDLSRMEAEANRIGLQLAVARDKQTIAEETLTAAKNIDGQVTAQLTIVEALAEDQAQKLKMAIDAKTEAIEANTYASDTQARTDEELARIDQELTKVNDELTAATNDRIDAQAALLVAETEQSLMADMTAIQTAELERLNRELIDAEWDLVGAWFADRDAQVALAEAGNDTALAIAGMSLVSEELAEKMRQMTGDARDAYPQFDTMRATLLHLEPQIASAKSQIEGFKDAIALLVREMELLNRTKVVIDTPTHHDPLGVRTVAPDVGGFTPAATAPTTSPVTTAVAATAAATTDVVAAVEDVAVATTEVVAAVEDVVTAVKAETDVHNIVSALENWKPPPSAVLPAAPSGDIHSVVSSLENMSHDDVVRAWLGSEGAQNLLGGFASAQAGGVVSRGGLVNVHAGETITPAGGGVTVIVNVEGSVSSERDLVESIRRGLLQAQKSGRSVVLN